MTYNTEIKSEKISSEPADDARIIGKITSKPDDPTIVFFAAVHGNEPAGVAALYRVFSILQFTSLTLKGNIYGILGNIPGLHAGKRYIEEDLNRIWTSTNIAEIKSKQSEKRNLEEQQLLQLFQLISGILKEAKGPVYFIDIHTTSSKTIPFITINDALINRKFAKYFPVPVVLGIEEFLEGPLLSYINKRGYVSLGFESGMHDEVAAVENAVSFIWLALVAVQVIPETDFQDFELHYLSLMTAARNNRSFYEVIMRHELHGGDDFNMINGFQSFQSVKKRTLLARHNNKDVLNPEDAVLFMPLYQKQGNEGFFLIRKIPGWALKLSVYLRKFRWTSILTVLPGISRNKESKKLQVNIKTVRFMRKPFFHLFGYRSSFESGGIITMSNRETTSKKEMYQNTAWFRK